MKSSYSMNTSSCNFSYRLFYDELWLLFIRFIVTKKTHLLLLLLSQIVKKLVTSQKIAMCQIFFASMHGYDR